ncbi:hypothetical protein GCM10023190_00740 [Enteractinococcus fodinae]|uniref:Uncharacterized protein n=1 Tax=Enteractinococcus fodinae TaxID=684663 RepID=A0ABU2B3S7_9MICC|nr:hypothetical protein [Enteractinococcus fodinae]MDR7347448.1 hypothetical protein [Enteractinococcus fodinae]
MFKITNSKRSKLYAGFAGVAALALFTACAEDTTPEEEPAEPGMQEEPAQDPNMEDPAEDPNQDPAEDPMQEDPADDGTDVEGAGESNATSTVGLVGNSVSWAL